MGKSKNKSAVVRGGKQAATILSIVRLFYG